MILSPENHSVIHFESQLWFKCSSLSIHIQSSTSIIHRMLGSFYYTTSYASDRAVVASRPRSVRFFDFGTSNFNKNSIKKSSKKEKKLQKTLPHNLFLRNYHSKKARYQPKTWNSVKPLRFFSNGLKVEATKIGKRREPVVRIDTSVDIDDFPLIFWKKKHPRSQAYVEGCPK